MDVRLVTSNPGKLREVRALLEPFGIRVLWARRALPEPQAPDLTHVVRSKLESLGRVSGPTVVDDSGLFIPSLAGFPGVYSAHIYEIWGVGPIIEMVRRRPRAAEFRTVAGLRTGKVDRLFTGVCHGTLVLEPRGRLGFGFDPIFRPLGSERTFGEMTIVEKNRFSHRSKAFRAMGRTLRQMARADDARSRGRDRKQR